MQCMDQLPLALAPAPAEVAVPAAMPDSMPTTMTYLAPLPSVGQTSLPATMTVPHISEETGGASKQAWSPLRRPRQPWHRRRMTAHMTPTTASAGTGVAHLQLPPPCNPWSGSAGSRTLIADGGSPASPPVLDEVIRRPHLLAIWPPALTATGPWVRPRVFAPMKTGTRPRRTPPLLPLI